MERNERRSTGLLVAGAKHCDRRRGVGLLQTRFVAASGLSDRARRIHGKPTFAARRVKNILLLPSCWCSSPGAKLTLLEEEDNTLSEVGSGEDRDRRQRAHGVVRTLESLHLEGSDIDAETMAIAQRYVDGEITLDELTAAIETRSRDES